MKNYLTYFLSCALLLASCFSFAQEKKASATNKTTGVENNRSIDSLLNVLKTLTSSSSELKPTIDGESAGLRIDTTKINTFNALWRQYFNIGSYDQAMQYAQHAQQLGEKLIPIYKNSTETLALKKGVAEAYKNIGIVYRNQGKYDEGMNNFMKSLEIYQEIGYKKGIANCYNNIGLVNWNKGDYRNALDYLLKSLKIRESMGDKGGKASALLNIGNIYLNQKDYENALKYYLKALKMNDDLRDKSFEQKVLNNIGNIYTIWGKYIKALEYHLDALNISKEIKDKRGIADSYDNIGLDYLNLSNTDSTKSEREKGYKIAMENCLKALTINLEIGNAQGEALNYSNIGNIYLKMGKLADANNYALKSLTLYKKIGEKEGIQNGYILLSGICEKKGDFKQSLEFHKLFSEMKDSLLNEKSSKQMTEMNTKYDSEKKDKEIQLLGKEKENQASLAAAEKKKQQIILFSISGFTLFLMAFAMVIFRGYRQKKLLNNELEKLSIVASETDNGVLICGPNGELEWINAGFTRLLGYSIEELKKVGNTLEEVSASPEIKFLIRHSIEHKKSSVYEALNIAKDGNGIWMQSTLTPILDKKGNIKKLVVIDTDVSERKKIEERLSEQNIELEKSHKNIEQKNLKIIDSILYARQIQQSILMEESEIQQHIPGSFIYYQPKDIVSGDFYWFSKVNDMLIIAAIDCTGHGVPGAFMSMIGNTLLNQIVNEKRQTKPSEILRLLNIGVYEALHQQKTGVLSHDGMDMALCCIDYKNNEVYYAGAKNPLYVVCDNILVDIKADNHTIGGGGRITTLFDPLKRKYTNHIIPIKKGMSIYLFTDGYMDQFGSAERKKFGIQQFKDLLLNNQDLDMPQQKKLVIETFEDWKGAKPQIDDVLIIGLRL